MNLIRPYNIIVFMKKVDDLWKSCVLSLSKTISDKSIIKKLENLKVSFNDKKNVLTINSTKPTLNLVKHYIVEIVEILRTIAMKEINVQIQSTIQELTGESKDVEKNIKKTHSLGLSPHFLFSNFITGTSYKEPVLALKNYIKHGYERYSPLFIYGQNGLGKTHLLHASGNELDAQGNNVIYLTVYKLLELQNKQIISKKKDTLIQEEINQYDVLLIDDIQNFEGKKGIISIFFDVVDYFIRNKKRVLLVADKRPNDLLFFKERIRSRLLSGLVVKVKQIDIETAINIVKKKRDVYCPSLKLSKQIVYYIADNFSHDVRAIEGALKRIDFFFISFSNHKIGENVSLEAVKHALKDIIFDKSGSVAIQNIIQLVCDHFNIPQGIIVSTSRKSTAVKARHIAMYLLRSVCKTSFLQIGRVLGGRNSSTVMTACKKIENKIKNKDKDFEKIEFLKKASKEMLEGIGK